MNKQLSNFVYAFIFSILFGVILFLSQYQHFVVLPCAALMFVLIPKNKPVLLVIISLIFLLIFDSFFYTLNFSSLSFFGENKNLTSFFLQESPGILQIKLISFSGIVFLLSLTFLYKKFKVLDPLAYLALWYGVIVLVFLHTTKMSVGYQLTLALMVVMAKSFWYVGLNLQTIRFNPNAPSFSELTDSIVPFWSFGMVRSHSVPNGWREIKFKLKQKIDLRQVQISGIRLAFFSLVLKYLSAFIYKALFGMSLILPFIGEVNFPSLELPNPFSIGFNHYNALNRSPLEYLFVTLINPLLYILREPVGDGGILIGFIRLMGINAPAQVDRPYLAKNFNDFFKRIYFYYNYLLVEFFVIPLYQLISKFDLSRKLRLFLSILLAVYAGGVILNYFRHDLWIVKYGPVQAFTMILGRSYYFAGVAFLSALAAIRSKNKDELSGIKKWVVPFFIYFCYALVFSMQTSYKQDDLSDRIEFLFRLSGLFFN